MGNRLIFLYLLDVTTPVNGFPLSDWGGHEGGPGKSTSAKTVPETDTGGLVEYTKALERTILKELGKLPP